MQRRERKAFSWDGGRKQGKKAGMGRVEGQGAAERQSPCRLLLRPRRETRMAFLANERRLLIVAARRSRGYASRSHAIALSLFCRRYPGFVPGTVPERYCLACGYRLGRVLDSPSQDDSFKTGSLRTASAKRLSAAREPLTLTYSSRPILASSNTAMPDSLASSMRSICRCP